MARVTELRVKGEGGTFTQAYPIGAEATNVTMSDGTDIETYLNEIINKINSFQILDNDTKLFSTLNTAYYNSDKADTLYLVSDFFEISDDGTTLTAIQN